MLHKGNNESRALEKSKTAHRLGSDEPSISAFYEAKVDSLKKTVGGVSLSKQRNVPKKSKKEKREQ